MPSHAIVTYYLLLICCPLCFGNTRRRLKDEEHIVSRRFIFDSNHHFTGWASWQQYAACSTLCVSGYEKQTKECCDTGDNRICYNIPWDQLKSRIGTCPIDGHWSNWNPWSYCTATCGGGLKTRYRNCTYPDHSLHGKFCQGSNNETRACSTYHCPVDGTWSNWSLYSRCSATCGNGTHIRTRTCNFDPRYFRGANCVGTSKQTDTCWAGACPVDGVWLTWSYWTACTVTCGGGVQTRNRDCHFQKHMPQGDYCVGTGNEHQTCNDDTCPVDGIFSIWLRWSKCTRTCGGGEQTRNRTCVFSPPDAPRGQNCIGPWNETQPCNENSCPCKSFSYLNVEF
ncbi:thrombospondin-2-like isoform X2 [Mercenaria mercenaria]|uniref:thrombospondin-2-like isoform X2 n=1 Tax=Mercenaria mercenaria TaxID=6596 RepID=UPI00234E4096|nr:thrombospondin-2-like isoform X2 [Mercenaria mercenaria]